MAFKYIIRALSIVLLVVRAKSHKSLTDLGLVAAAVTGLIHSLHPWSIFLVLLFAFYLPSTRFTKLKADIKKTLTVSESGEGGEGPRTHIQVLANSIVASVLILVHYLYYSDRCWDSEIVIVGIISQYAAVTADTWSSELGILSKTPPILITTLKPCPKGTNGGVTPLGLAVAVAAGAYIGTISLLLTPLCDSWTIASRFKFVTFITIMGLFGSVLDSVLGALFQRSSINDRGLIVEATGGGKLSNKTAKQLKSYSRNWDLLSNNQVNLSMATITSTLAMILWHVLDAK